VEKINNRGTIIDKEMLKLIYIYIYIYIYEIENNIKIIINNNKGKIIITKLLLQ